MGAGAGSPATVANLTWNPSDKNTDVTLSGGDLTMTSTASNVGARSNGKGAVNQLIFIEIVCDNRGFDPCIGFASSAESLAQRPGISSPSESFGVRGVNGFFNEGGNPSDGTALLAGALNNGDVVGIAYNTNTNVVWMNVNGTSAWNAGTAASSTFDPATGTGGMALVGGPYYFPIATCTNTDQMTGRFNSSSWGFTAPSGYSMMSG
jgi:hypothetical protein